MKYGEIYTYIQLFQFNGIYYIQMRLRVLLKNPRQLYGSCLGFLFCPPCPHFVCISNEVANFYITQGIVFRLGVFMDFIVIIIQVIILYV